MPRHYAALLVSTFGEFDGGPIIVQKFTDRPRSSRPLSALRRGTLVSRVPLFAEELRELRPRLQFCGCRRWTSGLRDSDRRRNCSVRSINHRSRLPAALLVARGAVASFDPHCDARATSPDQGPADCIAVSP